MHGIIFDACGTEARPAALCNPREGSHRYVRTATTRTSKSQDAQGWCQRFGRRRRGGRGDFGAFIVPSLLSLYKPLVKKDWKTLDLIEHTEETIHKVVRLQNPGAAPPALIVKRLSPREVVITYTSQRKMCGIAKGIAKGIAAHFHEKITIGETTCMLRGDPSCVIAVKLA